MPTMLVWDQGNSRVFRAIHDALPSMSGVTLMSGTSGSAALDTTVSPYCDALIVAPNASALWPGHCTVALAPGEAAAPFDALCLLTYGLRTRDTLTLSSQEADALVVAVQRDFTDLSGHPVVRGELLARQPAGLSREETLCYLGGLLLLGALAH